jgi:hypothetical protein
VLFSAVNGRFFEASEHISHTFTYDHHEPLHQSKSSLLTIPPPDSSSRNSTW